MKLPSKLDKIPKIIHCCWLSGEPIPTLYQQCIDSWKRHMPDYEIILWDTNRFQISSMKFVKQAVEAKKWAYASDYIRLYALYNHGGIYLDMDVMVYKSFDPFLAHSAFSSVEFNPKVFYKNFPKGSSVGLGIEAAVLGAEKGHPWIKDVMDFYISKEFINKPKFYWNIIMPRVMTKISIEKYGFRLVPIYQVLESDIHLYPPDVFSSCYDISINRLGGRDDNTYLKLGDENKIRYAFHICAHSWWEGAEVDSCVYRIKKSLINFFGKKKITQMKMFFNGTKQNF